VPPACGGVIRGGSGAWAQPAAFICEGLLSTAGYIVPPATFLDRAFAAAQAGGAVCIADEVQSGFGRAGGGYMWGFQASLAPRPRAARRERRAALTALLRGAQVSGVAPDIVTFGKPAGNGFPLAGVVTTAPLARAFANGMEYFNTFGGGPVAARVGSAVLATIRSDRVLEHVEDVAPLPRACSALRATEGPAYDEPSAAHHDLRP